MARWFISVSALLLLLVAWQAFATPNSPIMFFVGSPLVIANEFQILVHEDAFRVGFLTTGLEAATGLFLGTTTGAIAGLLTYRYRKFVPILAPLILGVGSVPILAFAPLMIVWFGVGIPMKIALAAITTFFISFAQAVRGARSVAIEHIEILKAMRATDAQLFRKAIVPGSLSWVLGSMRLNATFCLLGAFVGEFIASDRGLGYLILRASNLYNMPRALAASVGILILALAFDLIARIFETCRDAIAQLLSVPSILWAPTRIFQSFRPQRFRAS